MTMLDTKEKPVEGEVTEPAKVWRNKWEALENVVFACGNRVRQGEVIDGRLLWPSKDAAETAAQQEVGEDVRIYGRPLLAHVGAFPVTAP